MQLTAGSIGLMLSILVQTIVLASWLGRLSQQVSDLRREGQQFAQEARETTSRLAAAEARILVLESTCAIHHGHPPPGPG